MIRQDREGLSEEGLSSRKPKEDLEGEHLRKWEEQVQRPWGGNQPSMLELH